MDTTIDAGTRRLLPRLAAVDAMRGAAIAGVVVYHVVWDLAFLRLTGPELASHPLWIAFGRTLAGSFLFLAGFSLVLANGGGFRRDKYFRRLSKIVAAAFAVTTATWLAFPRSFVYFGILHAIAVASAAGVLLLRAPARLTALIGIVFLVVPRFFSSALFDPRWIAWIGFSANTPPSNDFVPVFPWLGVFLIGMATAQAADRHWLSRRFGASSGNPVIGGLAWLGRHSLAIYLLHQPALLAILYSLT
ncbi:heparan-alpha-glucosaminide N-acetyltransferase [Pararhizobium haloflavum]|uniref:heparan-alpha-glucosaminide N-acetyltransferase n=1 Tax=Pararhizobium haloflavum TaxID=2037914 RepID=UPI000C18EEE4|nr:heparan-alpha-glucosaminide N-acetyltransferase [Pararhizobium haloflavum]